MGGYFGGRYIPMLLALCDTPSKECHKATTWAATTGAVSARCPHELQLAAICYDARLSSGSHPAKDNEACCSSCFSTTWWRSHHFKSLRNRAICTAWASRDRPAQGMISRVVGHKNHWCAQIGPLHIAGLQANGLRWILAAAWPRSPAGYICRVPGTSPSPQCRLQLPPPSSRAQQ